MKQQNAVLKSKRLAKGAIAFGLLLGAYTAPANASTLPQPGSNPLAGILGQFEQYFSSISSYIQDLASAALAPLGEDIQAAISSATGSLGLPDPIVAREAVSGTLKDDDTLVYSTERATNEVDRQITRAAVSATLGEEGQQRTQESLQATTEAVSVAEQAANAAQGEVVTQNVMKQIATQNAQTTALLGALRQDSLALRQDAQLTNLNLTNISRAVDGQNRAAGLEKVGEGMQTLRASSQARLF